MVSCKESFKKRGGGITSSLISVGDRLLRKIPIGKIINTAIDALPAELHLPGYQYCGPGTRLKDRLKRGDPGINKLDQACKDHDIAYSKYSDSFNRTVADKILAEKAWERVRAQDSSLGERAAALAVTAAMKAKTAVGGGRKKRKQTSKTSRKRGGGIKRGRCNKKNKQKSSKKTSVWTMVKSGNGLYLRPYQNV
jgi:hypothetical protein